MGNIDRYPTYKGGKVTEVIVYANYIGLRLFYRYVVDIGRWSPYEGGQLDRFHCTCKEMLVRVIYILQWSVYLNEVPQIILQNDIRPTLIKNRNKYIHILIKLIQTIAIFMSLRTLAKVRALFF